jgi:hypothetical protein
MIISVWGYNFKEQVAAVGKKKRSRGEEVETIILLQEIRNYLSSAEAN